MVTLEGAEETPPGEIERRARKLAASVGCTTDPLEALITDASELDPGCLYRIDVSKNAVVAERFGPGDGIPFEPPPSDPASAK